MKIIESPRDAIQGINEFIPTELKIKYINTLLQVGFDIIDFGSFVSPKSIPQMSDVKKVVSNLYLHDTKTKLMAIVGNKKGALDLVNFEEINYIGYPFSISETFLKRNINSNFKKSLDVLDEIIDISINYDKKIIVYLSMGFGNPYDDEWSTDIVLDNIDMLFNMGITKINISDTIGLSTPEVIEEVFTESIDEFPDIKFGFHLHTPSNDWYNKIDSAYKSGVEIFDSVLGGYGGCPMTGFELMGNLNTKNLLDFCYDKDIITNINKEWLNKSINISEQIFKNYK